MDQHAGEHTFSHGSHRDNHLVSRSDVRLRAHWDLLEIRRTRGRRVMSAKIIPWRPRASVAAVKPAVYLPALIDGQVTVHALIEGLASAGLMLQHDAATGEFVIIARQQGTAER
jgi:hypothetical protein